MFHVRGYRTTSSPTELPFKRFSNGYRFRAQKRVKSFSGSLFYGSPKEDPHSALVWKDAVASIDPSRIGACYPLVHRIWTNLGTRD